MFLSIKPEKTHSAEISLTAGGGDIKRWYEDYFLFQLSTENWGCIAATICFIGRSDILKGSVSSADMRQAVPKKKAPPQKSLFDSTSPTQNVTSGLVKRQSTK